jgi:hypothetical protein
MQAKKNGPLPCGRPIIKFPIMCVLYTNQIRELQALAAKLGKTGTMRIFVRLFPLYACSGYPASLRGAGANQPLSLPAMRNGHAAQHLPIAMI